MSHYPTSWIIGYYLGNTQSSGFDCNTWREYIDFTAKPATHPSTSSSIKVRTRCVRFCKAAGKQDYLAIVGHDGYLTIHQLRRSVGQCYLETVKSRFLEAHLLVVAWST
eukprot:4448863-Ditylum_brightwellii.AAC.1